MADRPFETPLPADLPEDWTSGQIIAPAGADVGLSEQHGYNYLMAAVNAAQRGVNQVQEILNTGNIENVVTADGGGHMEMGESLGEAPYTITVTEETDEPLTAEDVGAIPMPDSPQKGQTIIFDGEKWVPGDVMSDIPIASAYTLGGIKVGDSLEISQDGVLNWNTDYFNAKKESGTFSSAAVQKFSLPSLAGRYPFLGFKIHIMNRTTVKTTFTVYLYRYNDDQSGTVLYQQESISGSGFTAHYSALLGEATGVYNVSGTTASPVQGTYFGLSSSAGVGTYEITAVGFGPKL